MFSVSVGWFERPSVMTTTILTAPKRPPFSDLKVKRMKNSFVYCRVPLQQVVINDIFIFQFQLFFNNYKWQYFRNYKETINGNTLEIIILLFRVPHLKEFLSEYSRALCVSVFSPINGIALIAYTRARPTRDGED